jgi:hypothetical protein
MRTSSPACLLSLLILTPACGNVFVRANWGGGTQTASGVVSVVRLTVVKSSGWSMPTKPLMSTILMALCRS